MEIVAEHKTKCAYADATFRSTFTMNINQDVGMTIEFLSPVLPNHMKRQSLPFSYMNVQVGLVSILKCAINRLTIPRSGHSMAKLILFSCILT